MQYVVYDNMGVPRVVESHYRQGNNVVGVMPLPNNGIGPNGGNWTNVASLNQEANGLLELATLHNMLLVNDALVSSGTGMDPKKQDPVTTIARPWLEAPEGSVPFDPQTVVVLPAVAGTATVVTLVVPDGYDGVINAYSWNFTGGGFVQGSGDIQVQMLRNGAAVRNYDNILVEKGTIQQPRVISPLRIYSGQTLSLVVNHIANVALNGQVVGCFSGYFYPAMS